MARPKTFDRDTALKVAMEVFWAKGFAGASAEDLTQAMGIGRQSLYDTFGDKKRLYLEALERYSTEQLSQHGRTLNGPGRPAENLKALLVAFAEQSEDLRRLGCFGLNAICEFGQDDPDVQRVSDTQGRVQDDAFRRLVKAGQAAGDFDAGIEVGAAARLLAVTLAGMKIQARAGATAPELREVAELMVDRLKPS
jgi:TetR/AcrR family transcriptional repressor of nem operon